MGILHVASKTRRKCIAILLLIFSSTSVTIMMLVREAGIGEWNQEVTYTKERIKKSHIVLQDKQDKHEGRPTRGHFENYKQSQNVNFSRLPNTIKQRTRLPSPETPLKQQIASTKQTSSVCSWLSREMPKAPYFLTAVLLVRIYEYDKAQLTSKEMVQWLQYLRYAGVEHVYVYDAWVHGNESQKQLLSVFIKEGFVTYIDWHTHNPYTIGGTQVAAYQHCIKHYGNVTRWQTAIDIDEYPFSPKDTSPGFLYRFVQGFGSSQPQISEITMQNYIFLGKPLEKELLMDRLLRRTPKPANQLVKPIYKPENVQAQVHHNVLRKGRSISAHTGHLRLNHYWGARLQNWGEDTPHILAITEPDNSIKPIVTAFRNCKPYLCNSC